MPVVRQCLSADLTYHRVGSGKTEHVYFLRYRLASQNSLGVLPSVRSGSRSPLLFVRSVIVCVFCLVGGIVRDVAFDYLRPVRRVICSVICCLFCLRLHFAFSPLVFGNINGQQLVGTYPTST